MINSFENSVGGWSQTLVQVHSVIDVKRRQQREHIGLNGADQKLERVDARNEDEADERNAITHRRARIDAVDNEIAEHIHKNVASNHRHEKTQGKPLVKVVTVE